MKIFIINLKRRDDKLVRIKDRISKIELDKYYEIEIFNAIDGIEINKEYLIQNNYKISLDWNDNLHRRPMKWGEIGCAISHYQVWNKIIEQNLESAIILEDDVIFKSDFINNLKEILDSLENNKELGKCEMVYLGRKVFNKVEESVSEKLVKPNFSYWTLGYILKKGGATKLIESGYNKNLIPVDEFLPYMYGKNSISNYNIIDLNNNKKRLITYALKEDIIHPENQAFRESDTERSETINIDNNDNILVISVATYETDCYKRFIRSLEHFNLKYKILGFSDTKYSMTGIGGGFKIKLLNEYLDNMNLSEDTIIIFTDSFDVIFNDNGKNIIEKYKKIVKSYVDTNNSIKNIDLDIKNKIIFSTEISCWPDTSLKDVYQKVETKYKYLNSGGFIGYVGDIKRLVNTYIDELDDDQLYYTKKFLENKNDIILDYNCEIFQTLNNISADITLNIDRSEVLNKYTNTKPSIIHGNGNSKLHLNNIGNYIPNRWSEIYGYMETSRYNTKMKEPNIAIVCNKISNVMNIKYDKERIYYFTNGIYDSNYITKKMYYLTSEGDIIKDRIKELEIIRSLSKTDKIEYVIYIDDTHVIEDLDVLDLIKHGKEIITPMLVRKDTIFSNFWGDIGKDGYYSRSDDYVDIVSRKRQGIWCVPYIQNTFIFKIELIDEIINGYKSNDKMDMDMRLSKYLRDNNYLMYVDNLKYYGHIVN